MKLKFQMTAALLAISLVFCSCGKNEAQRPEAETDNSVKTTNQSETPEKTPVSDEERAVSAKAVEDMLEDFKALSYDAAMEHIRKADRSLFDFEGGSQRTLYDSLFAKLSYETGEGYISEGREYIHVDITAPDMLYVYGEINLRYLDAMLGGELADAEEARAFNDNALADIVGGEELEYKTMPVEIELVSEDGEKRVVFTAALMNAMLGDIQTAQAQVSQAIEEGTQEYTSAKEAGAI